jgi:peroxiredoxin
MGFKIKLSYIDTRSRSRYTTCIKSQRQLAKVVEWFVGGPFRMVALLEGTKAPAVSLTSIDGSAYSLYQTLKESQLILLAFTKASCPVCQLELPYLERLHRSYPNIPIWAVSQDDGDVTSGFAKMFGITFPMLLDLRLASTVDYGLTIVPSLFLVGADGTIRQTIVGFVKNDLEKLNLELAMASGYSSKPLFSSADEVPAVKPGCASKQPA